MICLHDFATQAASEVRSSVYTMLGCVVLVPLMISIVTAIYFMIFFLMIAGGFG